MSSVDQFLYASRRPVVVSRHGSVACSDTRAAQAGLDILRAGGNAADAAVAVAAALNVTLPMSCGIGGDAFCLFYKAKTKSVHALNGSGRSSSALTLEHTKSLGYSASCHWPERHGLTVTVPGAAAALTDTVKHFGSGKDGGALLQLSLAEVFNPAITLAEQGFPVGQVAAYYWKQGVHLLQAGENLHGKALLIDGEAPKWGQVFHNPDLAASYRRLAAEGAAGFYTGHIAAAVVEAVQQHGGLLTLDDLAAHQSTLEEAVSTEYEGVRLWEVGPNSQGMVALMTLNLLKGTDLKGMGHNTADYLHHVIEAVRLSFADGARYIADPAAHLNLPTATLLSDEYANERRKLINPHKAAERYECGDLPVSKDTVYLTVVDGEGNACSFIMSNYMGFGTGIVPRGAGFTLQNRGFNFSLDEGHPNVIAPGKRPYHTIIPAMLTDDKTGGLLASYGVMGGFMQPQGHVQVLLNMKLFHMDPQRALDQPRFLVGSGHRSPVGAVNLEEGIPQCIIDDLVSRGHDIIGPVSGHQRALFGRGHVITCGAWWANVDAGTDSDPTVLWAGSDMRADGAAVGY